MIGNKEVRKRLRTKSSEEHPLEMRVRVTRVLQMSCGSLHELIRYRMYVYEI